MGITIVLLTVSAGLVVFWVLLQLNFQFVPKKKINCIINQMLIIVGYVKMRESLQTLDN